MKNMPSFLSALSLIGALAFFASCDPHPKETVATTAMSASSSGGGGANKIAYVNVDSLEANYELLKAKRAEFKTRQEQMENELQSSYQQMQGDAAEVQKKAQANTMTQDEYDAAQKRLMQMQKSLQTRKESLTDQLMKEQDDFNKDLKSRLDAFLSDYNKTHHYDYILSYSAGGSSILYAPKM
jgi:outer membrane protein